MGGSLGALASQAAGAADKHRSPSIRSPRDGQRLPARPALVELYMGSAQLVGARLNGQRIGDDLLFGRTAQAARCADFPSLLPGRTCRLRASPSDGLRYGPNVLRARFKRHGSVRVRKVRFRVGHQRPLAAAGRDRLDAGRRRIHLNGRRSLVSPALRQPLTPWARYARLRYRWHVVRAPRGSHGTLTGAHTATPVLKLGHRVERSKVRLTVTAPDGRTGSDSVTVVPGQGGGGGVPAPPRTDPAPAVPIDTMSFDGSSSDNAQSGIKLGTAPCSTSQTCYQPAKFHHWAQLVVLDRKTLKPVGGKLADLANKTYDCDFDNTCAKATNATALSNDLARLSPNELAIVSNPQPDPKYFPPNGCASTSRYHPVGLEGALKSIGVSSTGFDTPGVGDDPCSVGAISAIGVPGTKPGTGAWHTVAKQPGGGRMQGYLIRSNHGDYTFASYDRADFNTQAEGSSDSQNVIQVGNQTFTQSYTGGGFQVVVLDPQTLAGQSQFFETDLSDRSALLGQLNAMRQTVFDAARARMLVFITSLGDPAIQYYKDNGITSPDNEIDYQLSLLVDYVEGLGGTTNNFYEMLDPALYGSDGFSYTLLGDGNLDPGQGMEAVRAGINATGPPNDAALSGTLARTGPNYVYQLAGTPRVGPEVQGADPSRATSELTHIVFQRPSAWPEQGNPGRTAAISWIGLNVKDLGTSDPRGQYFTHTWNPAFWTGPNPPNGGVIPEIKALSYPQGQSFSEDDFQWAKGELITEIGWLVQTHSYLDDLATPFASTGLQSWADLQSTAAHINGDVHVNDRAQIDFANAKTVFDFYRSVQDELPFGIGEGALVLNDIYDLAVGLAENNAGQPAGQDFNTTVADVGASFAQRLSAAQEMLTNQFPNTIAADYDKLKAIGACASRDQANCPFDVGDWQYTQSDQQNAEDAALKAANVWAYSQLLPAKYEVFHLDPWWKTHIDHWYFNHTYLTGFTYYYPFDGLPDSAQLAKPLYRNIPSYSHTLQYTGGPQHPQWISTGDTWQMLAMGDLENSGTFTDPWSMKYPDASVTDKLFGSPADGGLGVDAEAFFDSFIPKGRYDSLSAYPTPSNPVGWCGGRGPDDQCEGQSH
jgi:hypothetical protein